MIGAK
ncbi:hypothetical protein Egran_00108, partial [Elaphomyces granulatus]